MNRVEIVQVVAVLALPFGLIYYNDWLFYLICHPWSDPASTSACVLILILITVIAVSGVLAYQRSREL